VVLVNKHSRKLAERRDQKDLQLITEIVGASRWDGEKGDEPRDSTESALQESTHEGRLASPTGPMPVHPAAVPRETMLIARGMLMEQRKEQLRQQLLSEEGKECTFHPKINDNGVPAINLAPSLSRRIKSSPSQSGSLKQPVLADRNRSLSPRVVVALSFFLSLQTNYPSLCILVHNID
jgi:hypothetical protein